MYASGYSEVSKYSPQTKKKMHYHSKGKSCGYYMRIVFFFSSLIQSLIIVSLVLFLIYGKDQDSASMSHVHDLEESFSRLSIENVALRQQRKNLTNLLNATLIEKARNDFDLNRLRSFCNTSAFILLDQEKRKVECFEELKTCKARLVFQSFPGSCSQNNGGICNCERFVEHIRAKLNLVEANLTQTIQRVSREKEEIAKERDHLNLEAIKLRRMKFSAEKEVEFCRESCKTDFANSLNGISNVTKAFLQKIDSLFPSHIAFQLTCPKQREHLEQIRHNCTSLSREVEDKFQRYLDSVGAQMSMIHAENSRFKAENLRVSEDYRVCTQNRTAIIEKNKRNMEDLQQKQDRRLEKALLEKGNLIGELMLLNISVNVKNKEVEYLKEELKQLELNCKAKTMMGMGGLPGGSQTGSGGWNPLGSGSSSTSQLSRTVSNSNYGSFASTLNRAGSTGTGSLTPSLSAGSSTGSGYNKPASTGTGSTGSSFFSGGSSSSTGSGYNKPASTGTGSSFFSSGSSSSTGSGYNKPASTGTGSTGSSFFSSGTGSSTGSGLNKPASTGTGSTGSSFFSSGSGSSTGSGYNKPASTGTGSTGSSYFSSGSGSSTGSGLNKPASTGTGSTGSSFFSSGSGSSTGSGYNKPASTGTGSTGSSFFSGGSGSSTGSGYNKPASTGTGSTGSSFFSGGSGSSTGSGYNKPASTGTGSTGSSFFSSGSGSSTGSGLNKPASTGTGSSSTSLLSSGTGGSVGSGVNKPASGVGFFGSASSSSSASSSGTSLNKPALTGRSPSATESGGSSTSYGSGGTSPVKPSTNTRSSSSPSSSSGSTGTSSKSTFSWFLGGGSKKGSDNGQGPSARNSYGGFGIDEGGLQGRGGGPYNVIEHVRDLRRFIKSNNPEEKEDLSTMLG